MKRLAGWTIVLMMILGSAAVSAQEEEPAVQATRLTENLHMLSTDQGSYTTNTLAFLGDDGILLVDTQAAGDAEELKKVVDGYGKGVPRYIINTHVHVEHIGGNAIFGASPVIIAHERLPERLQSGSFLFEEYPEETFPDITFSDSLTLRFNGETIRLHVLAGSHDDSEIIVHFTGSKVVHLSSLTNGFNFPSVDIHGDVLQFEKLVSRAIEMLPEDVVIVSGHNDTGTREDLLAYREMLAGTTAAVRKGIEDGKDVETLQEEKILDPWKSYAGSYVSVEKWTESLFEAIRGDKDLGKSIYEPVYRAWKQDGAAAAVALYFTLKREQPDEYGFGEFVLLGIGDKLSGKGKARDAVAFLEASLEDYPDSPYAYYVHFRLAGSYRDLGDKERAIRHCEKTLELRPESEAAKEMLEELRKD